MPLSAPSVAPELIRVIVIEDNEDDRILLLRQLKSANMSEQIKFIPDGKEAIDYFQTHTAALAQSLMVVFLDLKLPSVSGLEVLRAIRAEAALAHVPVIVMTSSNNPKDLEECQALRVAQWVDKPITFDTFSRAIADTFHRR
ncbi:MAG: hypothetical protein B9S32_10110 [Verrucomicrobia bacterium Tous-C9LFEB]|nr:MAG: hypothetical protein B9S32_10110 [Verrucomicrobia bacterium Tous-C9LFEB]